MNIQEHIEKAFKAGAGFASEKSYTELDTEFIWSPTLAEVDEACTEYVNKGFINGSNE